VIRGSDRTETGDGQESEQHLGQHCLGEVPWSEPARTPDGPHRHLLLLFRRWLLFGHWSVEIGALEGWSWVFEGAAVLNHTSQVVVQQPCPSSQMHSSHCRGVSGVYFHSLPLWAAATSDHRR